MHDLEGENKNPNFNVLITINFVNEKTQNI